MRKDDSVRLLHMLEAAQEAISFTKNKTRKSLNARRQLVLALVKDIEIIAASSVTAERREELPRIPGSKTIGVRNRPIHAYFEINLDVLWKTITEDIPPLISQREKIAPSDGRL